MWKFTLYGILNIFSQTVEEKTLEEVICLYKYIFIFN